MRKSSLFEVCIRFIMYDDDSFRLERSHFYLSGVVMISQVNVHPIIKERS